MYKKYFIRCRYSIKNEKALKEVSKLAGPDTVVTIFKCDWRTGCTSIN